MAGSVAYLIANMLKERMIEFVHYDPHVEPWKTTGDEFESVYKPAVYLICTKHEEFSKVKFPEGSVVIDPFRYVCEQPPGVKVIKVGIGPQPR